MKKNSSIHFTIIVLCICGMWPLNAQDSDKTTITIQTYSTVKVPADEIVFTLTLRVLEKDAQSAFDKHKKIEKKLVSLLRRLEIADSCITYSLMDIAKEERYQKNEIYYRAQQRVYVKLSKISQYESFQIALLSNGINSFQAKFSSSQKMKFMSELPLKALEQARAEAKNIADGLGKKIGRIIDISTQRCGPSMLRGEALTVTSDRHSLSDIRQFVQFRASITVKFELLD